MWRIGKKRGRGEELEPVKGMVLKPSGREKGQEKYAQRTSWLKLPQRRGRGVSAASPKIMEEGLRARKRKKTRRHRFRKHTLKILPGRAWKEAPEKEKGVPPWRFP